MHDKRLTAKPASLSGLRYGPHTVKVYRVPRTHDKLLDSDSVDMDRWIGRVVMGWGGWVYIHKETTKVLELAEFIF